MQDILFLIGFIIAIIILVRIVYRIIVSGFKSYFHDIFYAITEVTGREKNIFYKINSYTLIVFGLLAPIILFAYPLFIERFPDWLETSKNFLLHAITLLIYLAAMIGGGSSCYPYSSQDMEIEEGQKKIQMREKKAVDKS